MTTPRICANPTCTRTIPHDAPTWRDYCDRRCQVATGNARGYMSIRVRLTADEMHALEDYAEGDPPADMARFIILEEIGQLGP